MISPEGIRMLRFLEFYWLCSKHAWRGCWTRTSELAAILGGGILWAILWIASPWLQEQQMIEAPSTYWGSAGYAAISAVASVILAFVVIFVGRFILAPSRLYWAERDRAGALSNQVDRRQKTNESLSRLADYLGLAQEMMRRRIEDDEQLSKLGFDYKKWTVDVVKEIAEFISPATAKAFGPLPSVQAASFTGVLNEKHNDLKLVINARMKMLAELISRHDQQNK